MAKINLLVAVALFMLRGCVPVERYVFKKLSPRGAAKFAAKLANRECEELYKRKPFSPKSYKAIFRENRWHWGKFDPAGIHGYSAEVSFKKDGSDPRVDVFFSSDSLEPPTPDDIPKDELRELMPLLEKRERVLPPPEIFDPEN